MAKKNILDTVKALYSSLTKTEKHIANVLLEDPEKVNKRSLSEISDYLEVGEATFIRFCRTIGFKGFTSFKLALAIELATRNQKPVSIFEKDINIQDSSFDIAKKLQVNVTQVIEETINLIDFNELNEIIQILRKAKRIFLFGVGASGLSAEEAKIKFMRIGLSADAITNNHFMYMQAALMNKDDVVIGISHSGNSKEILQALSIAKKNGTTTIALTHHLRSPITKIADFKIIHGSKQRQLQSDSLRTKIAQLFILDLVYMLLIKEDEENAIECKQKTINAILEQRMSIN